jgi:hypothetical protein
VRRAGGLRPAPPRKRPSGGGEVAARRLSTGGVAPCRWGRRPPTSSVPSARWAAEGTRHKSAAVTCWVVGWRWSLLFEHRGWPKATNLRWHGAGRGQGHPPTPNLQHPEGVQDEPNSSRLRRLQGVQRKPLRGKAHRGCRGDRLRRPCSTPGYERAALRAAQSRTPRSLQCRRSRWDGGWSSW